MSLELTEPNPSSAGALRSVNFDDEGGGFLGLTTIEHSFTVESTPAPTRPRGTSGLGSVRNVGTRMGSAAASIVQKVIDTELKESRIDGVGEFNDKYEPLTDYLRFHLCLPQPGEQAMSMGARALLGLYMFLGVLHVVAGVFSMIASFVFVGFGSHSHSKLDGFHDILVIITSFDFVSQVAALVVGVLTMWWFVLTRDLAMATLHRAEHQGGQQSRQEFREDLRLLASARSGSAVGSGFGWDFYISYFGESTIITHGTSSDGKTNTDAALFSSNLQESLKQEQHGGQVRYPSGCFLDAKILKNELAVLRGKIKNKAGVLCPAGPQTGFHIFLSYRRKNVSDARSLKQAFEKKGYRIFMDLDPGGLGAGNFQEQLERVLNDVPVVVMHCSETPHKEFARINNDGDFVRLEIKTALEKGKLLVPVTAEGSNIGTLFQDLPADCARLRDMNAIPLPDSNYYAAIDKIHDAIETHTEQQDLVGAQRQRVAQYWQEIFYPHLANSSVVVLIVTEKSLAAMRNPKSALGVKLLEEWKYALKKAPGRGGGGDGGGERGSDRDESGKWATMVIPVFLCGHDADDDGGYANEAAESELRRSSPSPRGGAEMLGGDEQEGGAYGQQLLFREFTSVPGLIDAVLGPIEGQPGSGRGSGTPSSLSRAGSRISTTSLFGPAPPLSSSLVISVSSNSSSSMA